MKRRKFFLGLGTTIGGASLLGSGAFSSAAAERLVTIDIADDTKALLALVPTSEYATLQDGVFKLDISSSNPTDTGGIGVNSNANIIINDAFKIKNQGSRTVELDFKERGDNDPFGTITLTSVEDDVTVEISHSGDSLSDLELTPGDELPYSVEVFAGEGATSGVTIDETVTITAEAVED